MACQHGARRLALMNLQTGQRYPTVSSAENGKRLNGPNDVVVRGNYVYFTDPVYAWLEKERFEDLSRKVENTNNENGWEVRSV